MKVIGYFIYCNIISRIYDHQLKQLMHQQETKNRLYMKRRNEFERVKG